MFCLRVLGWSKFLSGQISKEQSNLLKEGNRGIKEREGLRKL